jgi:predicted ferric reductase
MRRRRSDPDSSLDELLSPAYREARDDQRAVAYPRTTGYFPYTGPTVERPRLVITATGTIPRVRLPQPPLLPPLPPEPADIEAPAALHHEYVGDWGYRPTVPQQVDRGARVFIMVLFWFMLVASVELWWLDTPAHTVHGTGPLLLESGRVTGMVAGFFLLMQILVMSRAGWLERWVGAHDLLIWHRELGGALVVLVLAHVVLITFGYAADEGISFFGESREIWNNYPAMISAYIATAILVVIGVMAIRAIRRRMRYEIWYYTHLASYLVLLLSYGHQFAAGQELSKGGFGHWYWVGLYLLVVACLAWGRILWPLVLNTRHRMRVAEVVTEVPDMVSIYIKGRRLEDLEARAGQYFRWRFMARGCWWQAHPFSLSAAPNRRWLRLTIKVVGDHTADLRHIRPGTRIVAEGPWGIFTAEHRRHPAALLIAGGSGIAPIRALLEELPTGSIVLYRASTLDEVVFREELEWLADERRATLWYVLGSRDDPGPKRAFSPRGMRELAPDLRRRDVYLCGPPGLIDASLAALQRLKVPKRQIHMDPFEF